MRILIYTLKGNQLEQLNDQRFLSGTNLRTIKSLFDQGTNFVLPNVIKRSRNPNISLA